MEAYPWVGHDFNARYAHRCDGYFLWGVHCKFTLWCCGTHDHGGIWALPAIGGKACWSIHAFYWYCWWCFFWPWEWVFCVWWCSLGRQYAGGILCCWVYGRGLALRQGIRRRQYRSSARRERRLLSRTPSWLNARSPISDVSGARRNGSYHRGSSPRGSNCRASRDWGAFRQPCKKSGRCPNSKVRSYECCSFIWKNSDVHAQALGRWQWKWCPCSSVVGKGWKKSV